MTKNLGFAKDIKDYLSWSEEIKVVEFEWLNKSGFKSEAEKKGLELRRSKPEKVETRKIKG